ncbi:MAG: acetyl-CoA carboxylase carboxyltransferase subunit alpha [Polyangiales bacterium]
MAHLAFEASLVQMQDKLRALQSEGDQASADDIHKTEERIRKLEKDTYAELGIWQKVQLSRHPERPYFLDYLDALFEDFVELHGDRRVGDDPAIIAGFARFEGESVAVIGQQKGRTTKQKLHRNFGMPQPEGYRKACRVMELAGRFGRPVFTFIDTPGAYPGVGAEERGQSEAIGQSLLVMSRLRCPIIATIIGEGGSGGALALGVANRVLMLEYATYSVITPEGCASILWRDGAKAPEAAEQLKLLAEDARRLGAVDNVVQEPFGGAHRDKDVAATELGRALRAQMSEMRAMSPDALVQDRYAKFRDLGAYVAS